MEVAEGTTVDGRYRILDRIGSGGMADVYRAEDTHLGRDIAVKVLHRRFAQDAEFVERFRREAKSAAGLQHPHVVGVFDRGEHDGTYYIAMEHLRGRTLKDIVSQEAPIDQLRAIELGVQILRAADFAHRHGVIHRDFKPHNVIVDDHGHAKVTDFGIARAGASEMTETGSIMGTAQYLSPEQAQGHPVTAASDLYSIGVMLYELLTGKLPFAGDSAVSIALKHLSEPPPPMSGEGVAIEPNLEAVVMGALAKEPEARWQTGEDFAQALEACRPYVEALQAGAAVPQDTAVFGAVPEPPEAAAPPPPQRDGDDDRRRRWPAYAIGLLVLALVALMAWVFTRPEQVDVPKVEGLQLLRAQDRLEQAGFDEVNVVRQRANVRSDIVLRQDPDPGEQAAKDETIELIVSSGPGQTLVPAVRDLTEKVAIKRLEEAGLEPQVRSAESDGVDPGRAVRTDPPQATRVDRGSRVQLFISSGPEQVAVPGVVGLSRSSAEARLERANLTVSLEEQESDEPEDEVISQSPAAGTLVDPEEPVTITISKGREQVGVPDVTGLSEGAALRALRSAGLSPSVRERTTDEPSEDGQVVEQRPPPGSQVNRGSGVVLVVGRLREPPPEEPPPDTPPTGTP